MMFSLRGVLPGHLQQLINRVHVYNLTYNQFVSTDILSSAVSASLWKRRLKATLFEGGFFLAVLRLETRAEPWQQEAPVTGLGRGATPHPPDTNTVLRARTPLSGSGKSTSRQTRRGHGSRPAQWPVSQP